MQGMFVGSALYASVGKREMSQLHIKRAQKKVIGQLKGARKAHKKKKSQVLIVSGHQPAAQHLVLEILGQPQNRGRDVA